MYQSDSFIAYLMLRNIESKGAAPNIPPKSTGAGRTASRRGSNRDRNAVERMFGRLRDFRRIATHYDRFARNFLAAL
jgi:transposase